MTIRGRRVLFNFRLAGFLICAIFLHQKLIGFLKQIPVHPFSVQLSVRIFVIRALVLLPLDTWLSTGTCKRFSNISLKTNEFDLTIQLNFFDSTFSSVHSTNIAPSHCLFPLLRLHTPLNSIESWILLFYFSEVLTKCFLIYLNVLHAVEKCLV